MAGEAQSLVQGLAGPEAHEGCAVSGLTMRTRMQRGAEVGLAEHTERFKVCVANQEQLLQCVFVLEAALRNSSRILSVAKSWRFAVEGARRAAICRLIVGKAPPSPPIRTLGVTLMAVSFCGVHGRGCQRRVG